MATLYRYLTRVTAAGSSHFSSLAVSFLSLLFLAGLFCPVSSAAGSTTGLRLPSLMIQPFRAVGEGSFQVGTIEICG